MNKARARVNALSGYKKVNTYILGLIPIFYGSALILLGDALWRIDGLGVHSPYSVASQVPESPESWGWAAVVLGVVIIVGEFFGKSKVLVPGLFLTALWYMFFSITFVVDYFDNPETKVGLPPAVSYFFFSFLFANRLWYSFTAARIDDAP